MDPIELGIQTQRLRQRSALNTNRMRSIGFVGIVVLTYFGFSIFVRDRPDDELPILDIALLGIVLSVLAISACVSYVKVRRLIRHGVVTQALIESTRWVPPFFCRIDLEYFAGDSETFKSVFSHSMMRQCLADGSERLIVVDPHAPTRIDWLYNFSRTRREAMEMFSTNTGLTDSG